ncbi:tRNA 2-thiouridine(34) synthase MnmA [Maridesulfovibrio hydrothermalis]|uniref:tRNA-uridine 2-sulfurtransferase n=1 Tax=Maridesulfovibrio hydrothermalis AM13 = DSM 14728 TaxID=1121451 RepID=L0RD91_9BACT|nr:tRNA 2-thiouridine(34) synthase MnmA [Maridesulfovibrio hydrothermalis]CCO24192.1 tRNA-specific 2-thiouridylase mnmA [Maridesulfovibrio hydrothermalis AM13 = DSM 14728]
MESGFRYPELKELVAGRKAAMAVSGGADSLLSLVLLKESGADVIAVHGCFLGQENAKPAVAGLEKRCAELDVPLHVFDFTAEFDKLVVEPFVQEYLKGNTPNPCALCNPEIKFGILNNAARELGAQLLGTGHYVRLAEHPEYGMMLARGADIGKDQSYFLSLVPKMAVLNAVFPLGGHSKEKTYAELAKRNVEIPLPSESQEICFVPDDDYRQFLMDRDVKLSGPGDVMLTCGTKIGRHKGLWRYTQGQRRGLGIAWKCPIYVLDKDMKRNILIVGTSDELDAAGCVAGAMNYHIEFEKWPETVFIQTRYRQRSKPSKARKEGNQMFFDFIEPHSRPTPGQIVAVYTEDGAVLAGGLILGPL